ncbi:MAG: class I SAM-dependent methyltransferase [Actinomycetota bacterium]
MSFNANAIEREKNRIETEYRRREREVKADLYAPWQPAESLIVAERKSTAAVLLEKAGKFPVAGNPCLEIGYGKLGWLADLISWGLRETDLHGIELDEKRARQAQTALPNADLRVGDATKLPWENDSFKVVVASTVFSSILDLNVRKLIAGEISRVVMPGGVLLWYDLGIDNPRNKNVKGISVKELKKLFPNFDGEIKSVTLAPPIARLIAPRSLTLATFLSAFPMLRTHLLGVLVKR